MKRKNLLIILIFVILVLIFFNQSFLDKEEETEIYQNLTCETKDDCVWAIYLDRCGSCPMIYNKDTVENNKELAIYEYGGDYSSLVTINCSNVYASCAHQMILECVRNKCIRGIYVLKYYPNLNYSKIEPRVLDELRENEWVDVAIDLINESKINTFLSLFPEDELEVNTIYSNRISAKINLDGFDKLIINGLVEAVYYNFPVYATYDGYSCEFDEDCVVKDVHNCCGYYPRCVNKNYEPDINAVITWCQENNISSICGWSGITDCKCINNKCESFQGEEMI